MATPIPVTTLSLSLVKSNKKLTPSELLLMCGKCCFYVFHVLTVFLTYVTHLSVLKEIYKTNYFTATVTAGTYDRNALIIFIKESLVI